MEPWKLLDTGPHSAAENMALDELFLERKAEGRIPHTLRFLQFSHPAVLVGHHQSVEEEVRLELPVNREESRSTGGSPVRSPRLGNKRVGLGDFYLRKQDPRIPSRLKTSTE